MTYHPIILVDTSILVAFYNKSDSYHVPVCNFFASCSSELLTSVGCVTEVMWLLSSDWRVQNSFLLDMASNIYLCEALTPEDFGRIAELNTKYADLNPDFADLSLVTISERLDIPAIATLDKDFDIYRRYRNQPFERIFQPQ